MEPTTEGKSTFRVEHLRAGVWSEAASELPTLQAAQRQIKDMLAEVERARAEKRAYTWYRRPDLRIIEVDGAGRQWRRE